MRSTIFAASVSLVLWAGLASAQGNDLEARIEELEAALDLLQDRIERLEERQTPRRVTEAEAQAVLRKKEAEKACAAELGPAPEFAPVLGTKVNPEYVEYNKKLRACMRERGVQ